MCLPACMYLSIPQVCSAHGFQKTESDIQKLKFCSQTQAAPSGHFKVLYEQSLDEGFAFKKKLGTVKDSTGSSHRVYSTSSTEGILSDILGP